MTDHDYAGCRDQFCLRCEDHPAGYRDGKSKSLFEVSSRTVDHPRGCGCEPCQAAAERRRRRGGFEAWLTRTMTSSRAGGVGTATGCRQDWKQDSGSCSVSSWPKEMSDEHDEIPVQD